MSTPAMELTERIDRLSSEAISLELLWQSVMDVPCPGATQLRLWLSMHSFDTVRCAIQATARKSMRLGSHIMTAEHSIRFVSSVANAQSRLLRAEEARNAA